MYISRCWCHSNISIWVLVRVLCIWLTVWTPKTTDLQFSTQDTLFSLCSTIAKGRLSDQVNFLSASKPMALPKENTDVRPIAIGEPFRRVFVRRIKTFSFHQSKMKYASGVGTLVHNPQLLVEQTGVGYHEIWCQKRLQLCISTKSACSSKGRMLWHTVGFTRETLRAQHCFLVPSTHVTRLPWGLKIAILR